MLLSATTDLAFYRVGYLIKTFVTACLTIVPIIVMIKCMIDLFKVVTNPNEASKTPRQIASRFISGLVVFLLPVITDYTFKAMTDYDDTIIVKYYEGASHEKIEEYKVLAEKEQEEAKKQREKEIEEANKKFAEEKERKQKELEEQGKTVLRKDVDSSNYDITKDTKYNNYPLKASCESNTLNYKIITVNGEYFTLIHATNPQEQLNNALAVSNTFGRLTGDRILNNEISSNNYQDKCMVAVNSSFFSYSTNSPVTGYLIHKGEIVKNEGTNGAVCGINGEGKLKQYVNVSADTVLKDGVKNTFGISSHISTSMSTGGQSAARTQIYQYDSNNFILYSGSGTVGGCVQKVNKATGATEGFNLDGGGSRKLYYKSQTQSNVSSFIEGGRPVPDMLYFVEA